MTLAHGGRLRSAATRWAIPLADWLDLSTGIAPWSWPVPVLDRDIWARLPEPEDGLIAAAADYYASADDRLLAVPGSQYAIRAVPRYRRPGTVGVPRIGYREHAAAWAAAGHRVIDYADLDALEAIAPRLDHAVVIAPNNPTGERASAARLAAIAAALGPGGLVVDAAFGDVDDTACAIPVDAIVLRSVGKFFGLAGIRLGFVIGAPAVVAALARDMPAWSVSHPARAIGTAALADRIWQSAQRLRITDAEAWLVDRLREALPAARIVSAGLFATVFFDTPGPAEALHAALARRAILTRLGDDGTWWRLGLVPAASRRRFEDALSDAVAT